MATDGIDLSAGGNEPESESRNGRGISVQRIFRAVMAPLRVFVPAEGPSIATRRIALKVKLHELSASQNPNTAFTVAEIMELADGVIVTRETDDEYCVYFDKSQYRTWSDTISDSGPKMKNFPTDTGCIYSFTLRSLTSVVEGLAKVYLVTTDGKRINWHREPIPVPLI